MNTKSTMQQAQKGRQSLGLTARVDTSTAPTPVPMTKLTADLTQATKAAFAFVNSRPVNIFNHPICRNTSIQRGYSFCQRHIERIRSIRGITPLSPRTT